MRFGILYLALVSLVSVVIACVSFEPPPKVIVTPDTQVPAVPLADASSSNALSRLDQVAMQGSPKADLVKDIRLLLQASSAQQANKNDQALPVFADLMSNAESKSVAEFAATQWLTVKANEYAIVNKSSEDFWKQEILENDDKSFSKFADRFNLRSDDQKKVFISKKLEDIFPLPIPLEAEDLQKVVDNSNIPIKDHKIVESQEAKKYRKFKEDLERFRQEGDRHKVSMLYQEYLSEKFDFIKLSEFLGVKREDLQLDYLREYLAAARNRALTGHYEDARNWITKTLNEISIIKKNVNKDKLPSLSEIEAEAHQILATRIEVESAGWNQVVDALNKSITASDDKRWVERVQWMLGLTHYSSGDFANAKIVWQKLLDELDKNNSDRSKVLFWLARTEAKIGSDSVENLLAQLQTEDPFGFYSIVAIAESFPEFRTNWSAVNAVQNSNLVDPSSFDLSPWRKDKPFNEALLRVEIAIAAELPLEIMQFLMNDLERILRPKMKSMADADRKLMRIYLTRLQYATGMFAKAFEGSAALQREDPEFLKRWPDQMFVFYPRAYRDVVEHATHVDGGGGISPETAWAVGRQESWFNASVKSPAGAIGLLQLMPATARRYLPLSQYPKKVDDIAKELKRPLFNVSLGSLYLNDLMQRYKGNRAAVYAAYNAGEFAVDAWLKKRPRHDPMIWVEWIPFSETNRYVRNVWRNYLVYEQLRKRQPYFAFAFDKKEEIK